MALPGKGICLEHKLAWQQIAIKECVFITWSCQLSRLRTQLLYKSEVNQKLQCAVRSSTLPQTVQVICQRFNSLFRPSHVSQRPWHSTQLVSTATSCLSPVHSCLCLFHLRLLLKGLLVPHWQWHFDVHAQCLWWFIWCVYFLYLATEKLNSCWFCVSPDIAHALHIVLMEKGHFGVVFLFFFICTVTQ